MPARTWTCSLAWLLLTGCPTEDGATATTGDATTGSATTSTTDSSKPTTSDATSEVATSDATTDTTTSSATTSSDGPSFAGTVWPILQPVCSCHTQMTPGPATGLDMGTTAESAYTALVDAPSPTVPGFVQVDPGSPDTSYLYLKLTNTHASVGGVGLKMPPGGMLSAGDLAAVEAWIAGGAAP